MPHSLRLSSTLGDPQIWAGSPTWVLPAAMRAAASSRCTLRLVAPVSPYSRLRFAKPFSPRGSPVLPATVHVPPSPAAWPPVCSSRLPPERSSFSRKFSTPAMASEPYCAAAPSRSTSTCRSAIDGMLEMSGPCAPSATPLPIQVMTAPRCRRFPFTSTSVWSGARPRRVAGRMSRAPSPTWVGLTFQDGTRVLSWSPTSVSPWATKSAKGMASMGTADSVTDRGRARLPTTTTRSSSPTPISTASGVAAPSASATPPRTTVRKPGRVNVTSYRPAGSPPIANRPSPPVTAVRASPPPPAGRASTVTPGRARPVASRAMPSTAAVWATAAPGARAEATTKPSAATPTPTLRIMPYGSRPSRPGRTAASSCGVPERRPAGALSRGRPAGRSPGRGPLPCGRVDGAGGGRLAGRPAAGGP